MEREYEKTINNLSHNEFRGKCLCYLWNAKIPSAFEKDQLYPFWKIFLIFHCFCKRKFSLLWHAIKLVYCSKVGICLIRIINPPGLLSHTYSKFEMLWRRGSQSLASSGAGAREEELLRHGAPRPRALSGSSRLWGSAQQSLGCMVNGSIEHLDVS